jgi:predicted RNA-binding Zn ribbon-like protein
VDDAHPVHETLTSPSGLPGLAVCLDFANTVGSTREQLGEELFSYGDVVDWSARAGLLTDAEARYLRAEVAKRPAEAAAVFSQAIALRETIFRLFTAVAAGQAPAAADLAGLNQALGEALGHLRLVPAGSGFDWGWSSDGGALERPLWPLARAAADLLASELRDRVRECAGDTCRWLFLDHSRNRSRRWCDMADCGNRAKARRYYQRQRALHAAS